MKSHKSKVKYSNFYIEQKLQYFVGVFLLLISAMFISSCSSSRYSQSDMEKYLTNERVKAKTSPISFHIPKGWHVVDANNEAFIDLWIVRNDLNVSLSLLPFHSNSTANTLEKNLEYSILLKQAKFKNEISIVKEKPIRLNDKITYPYSFSVDGNNYRIILFEHNNKYYELTLFGNNTNIKMEYFIQELFILSAK